MECANNLIDDHLDGELTDGGFRQLESWLRERDEHVREFATEWLIHSLLHDFVRQRQVQADALLRAMTTARGESHTAALPDALLSLTRPSRQMAARLDDRSSRWPALGRIAPQRYRLAGLAILLFVTLAAGTLTYFTMRPTVVAMLTQTADCRWEKTNGDIAEGALFHEGDVLHLTQGRALITFVSGVRVVIEGPTMLTVQSQLAANLTEGALTAKVPTQALGFTITSRQARFVDLGTEFTVRSRADESFELQVFEGMVELKLLDGAPLRISEGTAVKVDAASQGAHSIPYDVGQRISMP